MQAKAKRTFGKGKLAAVVACALALVVAVPLAAQAWSALQTPSYTWYTSGDHAGTESDPYLISGVRDYRGFVNIVNGTVDLDGDGTMDSDSFAGKYVALTSYLSLDTNGASNVVDPIGGAGTGKTFDGTFDGRGYTIDNYKVTAAAGEAATDLGLFGACGEGSTIKNVVVGTGAELRIVKAKDDSNQIHNVGLLVGYTAGSIENCSNNGTLYVETNCDQTSGFLYTILNVGGLAGNCLGDVSSCTNYGRIDAYAKGSSYTPTDEERAQEIEQEPIMLMNTGGVVGCAGALDHLVDPDSGDAFGTVSNCANYGELHLNTPSSAGLDRFNSPVYSESANTGGVAGYSRGSVLNCTNAGYVRAENGTYAAGVVGNVRARSKTVSAGSTSQTYDDGMVGVVIGDQGASSYDEAASEAGTIYVRYCSNAGDVMGNSSPGGVVGAAGTYTVIEGCTNGSGAIVMGTRWNKPFPAGIVASARGVVRYCANYGSIYSGSWKNEEERTVTLQSGYYVSGIAGNTRSYEDKKYNRVSPVPEVYGCYNAGTISAVDNMRQRGIVGDNEGDVYNNLLVEGTVYNNAIAYGMYEGDDEASGGNFANDYVISADLLRSGGWFSFVSTDQYLVKADENGTMTSLTVLNGLADGDGWETYWVYDTTGSNRGYPVLNKDVDWELTPLTDASVSLKANAEYTSVTGSVPEATVVLDGKTLVQDVDFRVVPDATAVDISVTGENPTPYTATIVGIGNYTGTATQTLAYGIAAGDFSTCTVSIETQHFDWEAHALKSEDVKVTTLSGSVVDPSEYTLAFDESDSDLTLNEETGAYEAINAGKYDVIVTAVEGGHFVNSVNGQMTIQAASILYSTNAENLKKYAYPLTISYAGKTYDWESTIALSAKPEDEQIPAVTFEYTGHPVDPDVLEVTYLGRSLVEGRDYRVMYGDYELLESGTTIPAGTENLGVKGGTGYGYIMVKCIPGGNFSNYEIMKFKIEDTDAKVDLAGAEVRGTDGVIFEGTQEYKPVTVWYANQQLTEGVDYTISYSDNTAIGTASYNVTAVADGPFGGSLSGTFDIVEGEPYTLHYTYDDSTMTATVTGVTYNGINDAFDLSIPAVVEFAGGDYDKIVYANNKYTVETAQAAAGTYTVTAIGDYAFGGGGTRGTSDVWIGSSFALSKVGIRSVEIPYTVETIGKYAFAGGSTYTSPRLLESVTFANVEHSRLETIDEGAFQACGNLTEFTFPKNVKTIAKNAFRVGSNTEPSKITKLTFLSEDPSLPSDVSTAYAFAGIGGKKTGAVTVYGYEDATAVKALVAANNTESSYGTNKGMRFAFEALSSPEPQYTVAARTYTGASNLVLVTYTGSVPDGCKVEVNGETMFAVDGSYVKLMAVADAALLGNSSFSFAVGSAPEVKLYDVNSNGVVNAVDAQIAYDLAVGVHANYSVLAEVGWLAADVTGDGYVDKTDSDAIHDYAFEADAA